MHRAYKINIRDLNTFCVDCVADALFVVEKEEDLSELTQVYDFKNKPIYVLGEGSNTLFNDEFNGVIVKNELKGVKVLNESDEHVELEIASGESWRDFVVTVSQKGFSGVENLAFIPGTLGAAAVQNIGAYGQVAEDVIVSVTTIDLETGQSTTYSNEECLFSYRYSIFKEKTKQKEFILSLTVRLNKYDSFDLNYHSRYQNESLKVWLEKNAKEPYRPIDIVNAVTDLRRYKLPWLDEYGTCGSFFTNPFVSVDKYNELLEQMSDLQCYPVTKMDYSKKNLDDLDLAKIVKIPAGRLLDELGWKGKWIGNVGTFKSHALCVVTNKKASSSEILDFVGQMKLDVKQNFDIDLKEEVVIVDWI